MFDLKIGEARPQEHRRAAFVNVDMNHRDVSRDGFGHHARGAAAPATGVAVPQGQQHIDLVQQDLADGFIGGSFLAAITNQCEGGAGLR